MNNKKGRMKMMWTTENRIRFAREYAERSTLWMPYPLIDKKVRDAQLLDLAKALNYDPETTIRDMLSLCHNFQRFYKHKMSTLVRNRLELGVPLNKDSLLPELPKWMQEVDQKLQFLPDLIREIQLQYPSLGKSNQDVAATSECTPVPKCRILSGNQFTQNITTVENNTSSHLTIEPNNQLDSYNTSKKEGMDSKNDKSVKNVTSSNLTIRPNDQKKSANKPKKKKKNAHKVGKVKGKSTPQQLRKSEEGMDSKKDSLEIEKVDSTPNSKLKEGPNDQLESDIRLEEKMYGDTKVINQVENSSCSQLTIELNDQSGLPVTVGPTKDVNEIQKIENIPDYNLTLKPNDQLKLAITSEKQGISGKNDECEIENVDNTLNSHLKIGPNAQSETHRGSEKEGIDNQEKDVNEVENTTNVNLTTETNDHLEAVSVSEEEGVDGEIKDIHVVDTPNSKPTNQLGPATTTNQLEKSSGSDKEEMNCENFENTPNSNLIVDLNDQLQIPPITNEQMESVCELEKEDIAQNDVQMLDVVETTSNSNSTAGPNDQMEPASTSVKKKKKVSKSKDLERVEKQKHLTTKPNNKLQLGTAPPQMQTKCMTKSELVNLVVSRCHKIKQVSGSKLLSQIATKTQLDIYLLTNIWAQIKSIAMWKLRTLLDAGDNRNKVSDSAQMSVADWAVADVVLLYDNPGRLVTSTNLATIHLLLPLVTLFHLVVSYKIEEDCSSNVLFKRWQNLTERYNTNEMSASTVLLMRRWYELKDSAGRKLRAHLQHRRARTPIPPPHPLHTIIARQYPHVVTRQQPTWQELVMAGRIFGQNQSIGATATRTGSTVKDDDVIVVDVPIETIDISSDSDDDRLVIDEDPKNHNKDDNIITESNFINNKYLNEDNLGLLQKALDLSNQLMASVDEFDQNIIKYNNLKAYPSQTNGNINKNATEVNTRNVQNQINEVVNVRFNQNIDSNLYEEKSLKGANNENESRSDLLEHNYQPNSIITNMAVNNKETNKEVILNQNTMSEKHLESGISNDESQVEKKIYIMTPTAINTKYTNTETQGVSNETPVTEKGTSILKQLLSKPPVLKNYNNTYYIKHNEINKGLHETVNNNNLNADMEELRILDVIDPNKTEKEIIYESDSDNEIFGNENIDNKNLDNLNVSNARNCDLIARKLGSDDVVYGAVNIAHKGGPSNCGKNLEVDPKILMSTAIHLRRIDETDSWRKYSKNNSIHLTKVNEKDLNGTYKRDSQGNKKIFRTQGPVDEMLKMCRPLSVVVSRLPPRPPLAPSSPPRRVRLPDLPALRRRPPPTALVAPLPAPPHAPLPAPSHAPPHTSHRANTHADSDSDNETLHDQHSLTSRLPTEFELSVLLKELMSKGVAASAAEWRGQWRGRRRPARLQLDNCSRDDCEKTKKICYSKSEENVQNESQEIFSPQTKPQRECKKAVRNKKKKRKDIVDDTAANQKSKDRHQSNLNQEIQSDNQSQSNLPNTSTMPSNSHSQYGLATNEAIRSDDGYHEWIKQKNIHQKYFTIQPMAHRLNSHNKNNQRQQKRDFRQDSVVANTGEATSNSSFQTDIAENEATSVINGPKSQVDKVSPYSSVVHESNEGELVEKYSNALVCGTTNIVNEDFRNETVASLDNLHTDNKDLTQEETTEKLCDTDINEENTDGGMAEADGCMSLVISNVTSLADSKENNSVKSSNDTTHIKTNLKRRHSTENVATDSEPVISKVRCISTSEEEDDCPLQELKNRITVNRQEKRCLEVDSGAIGQVCVTEDFTMAINGKTPEKLNDELSDLLNNAPSITATKYIRDNIQSINALRILCIDQSVPLWVQLGNNLVVTDFMIPVTAPTFWSMKPGQIAKLIIDESHADHFNMSEICVLVKNEPNQSRTRWGQNEIQVDPSGIHSVQSETQTDPSGIERDQNNTQSNQNDTIMDQSETLTDQNEAQTGQSDTQADQSGTETNQSETRSAVNIIQTGDQRCKTPSQQDEISNRLGQSQELLDNSSASHDNDKNHATEPLKCPSDVCVDNKLYKKLCDCPLVYGQVIFVVTNVEMFNELQRMSIGTQLYSLHTGKLSPITYKSTKTPNCVLPPKSIAKCVDTRTNDLALSSPPDQTLVLTSKSQSPNSNTILYNHPISTSDNSDNTSDNDGPVNTSSPTPLAVKESTSNFVSLEKKSMEHLDVPDVSSDNSFIPKKSSRNSDQAAERKSRTITLKFPSTKGSKTPGSGCSSRKRKNLPSNTRVSSVHNKIPSIVSTQSLMEPILLSSSDDENN